MRSLFPLITLLIMTGCTPKGGQNGVDLAATIFPLQDITRNISGGEVLTIIPPGANPHTFTPTPSLVKQLISAKLVIAISPEFDGWITKYVPASKVLFLIKTGSCGDHHNHKAHKDHNHTNPHIWLTPQQGEEIATAINKKLCALNKKKCPLYQKNLKQFRQQLGALQQELTATLKSARGRRYLQWHPAWDQFAKTFQLNIVDTIEHGHGDTPSVKKFHTVIEAGKKEKPAGLLIGINQNAPAADTLIRELNIPKIKLDTIGGATLPDRNSYIKLLRYNARTIQKQLIIEGK